MPITGLNLSISSKCSANCVFCPEERGRRDLGNMSPDLVSFLLEEAKNLPFPWEITRVETGENGDAFLNPDFIHILRLIKAGLPRAQVNLTTNLSKANREVLHTILQERLLTGLQLNVDGHDAESYQAQKRTFYERVMDHLRTLVELRASLWPEFPVVVHVLTLSDYHQAVQSRFRRNPFKYNQGLHAVPKSSFEQVKESLRWLPSDILLRKSPIFAWAERAGGGVPGRFPCPQLPRIENEAFISPSGLWYPCCLDANFDQAFGKVQEGGLMRIYHGEKRQTFLDRLRTGRLDEIGYPCNRSAFCQVIAT